MIKEVSAYKIRKGDRILYDREVRRLWLPVREMTKTALDTILLTLELPLAALAGLDEFTLPRERDITVHAVVPATQTIILWQVVDRNRLLTIQREGESQGPRS